MDADQLLQSLAVNVGMPELRFDNNGCARIAVDGAPAVNFEREEDGDALHVYSVIGPLPVENREAVYRQLLDANLYGNATGGASLAVDTLRAEVVLCRTFGAGVASAAAFVADVESLVAAAEDWQERLKRPVEDEETSFLQPTQPPDTMNRLLQP
jgi:hypothetical protein